MRLHRTATPRRIANSQSNWLFLVPAILLLGLLGLPLLVLIARAFGLCGRRADTLQEVEHAVESALTSRTSLVLEVPVDYREYYELV